MIKTYKLDNLDCANCAAKMENDISKLDEVNDAKIAFMTCRIKLDISDDTDVDALLDKAQAIIAKYEPDCRIRR